VQQPVHLGGDAVGLALGGADLDRVLFAQRRIGVMLDQADEARAPSAMKPACWLNSSKKFPSRGSNLPNSMRTSPRLPGSLRAAPPSQSRLAMDSKEFATASARLDVRALQCRRGERTLFRSVEFSVRTGEIVWLRGANGQGKTTLLRTLAGLSAPESGSVAWNDRSAQPAFLYLAHANGLKEDLTAFESLQFLSRLAGTEPSRESLDSALAVFGMTSRRQAPVRTLSQGQRRRVALARLSVEPAPPTWLLDEPFDALDAAGIETLNGVLVGHARRGGSIVLTSHVPLTIDDPAPQVVMLESLVAA